MHIHQGQRVDKDCHRVGSWWSKWSGYVFHLAATTRKSSPQKDVMMASSKTPRQADGIIMDYGRIFFICPSFQHNLPRRDFKKSDKGRALVVGVLVREVEVLDLVALVPVLVILPHVRPICGRFHPSLDAETIRSTSQTLKETLQKWWEPWTFGRPSKKGSEIHHNFRYLAKGTSSSKLVTVLIETQMWTILKSCFDWRNRTGVGRRCQKVIWLYCDDIHLSSPKGS